MNLLPKDVKFYDQFVLQARIVRDAAATLDKGLASPNGGLGGMAAQIREMEEKGNEIKQYIYRRLHQTFIVPIDPEDIHSLASSLDEVMDGIEAASYRIVAYGLNPIPDRAKALASKLHEATAMVYEVFEALERKGLENKEYLSAQCVKINELERQSERMAREAVTDVFAREKDPITLIRLKEIYEHFEVIGDRCETVANNLENIVAKNS